MTWSKEWPKEEGFYWVVRGDWVDGEQTIAEMIAEMDEMHLWFTGEGHPYTRMEAEVDGTLFGPRLDPPPLPEEGE